MVRHTPAALFEQLHGDSLLSLYAKRVNRIDQINGFVLCKLADNAHRVVKVSVNLQNSRAVIQTLRQLRMTDLPARHQYRALQTGTRSISRQTRRSVTRARTHNRLRA